MNFKMSEGLTRFLKLEAGRLFRFLHNDIDQLALRVANNRLAACVLIDPPQQIGLIALTADPWVIEIVE